MRIKSAKFIKGIKSDDALRHEGVPEIAFIGRSNVGKSSVINSLLNARELARTGSKQGKTREINLFLVNEKYYFVDLPGYGFAEGSLAEREIIREMTIGYFTVPNTGLHKVAVVLDAKVGITNHDRDMLEILHDNNHDTVLILNKTDKLSQKELAGVVRGIKNEFPEIEVLPYSATLNKGAGFVLDRLVA
ncbi:MAG: ribosome biogenesis GTP-binding protein YsxC [Candidatus Pacebacteria bacterium]|nr:ribosome biogenesis GTP-binding protein YsxC [Candidatus Paceibacterota bacterium]